MANNNFIIRSFKSDDRELYLESIKIRYQVFIQEQNVDPALEVDEFEDMATYYLLFADNKAISTARWRKTENGIKLERFATLKEYRNKGYGKILLENILNEIKNLSPVFLHSQEEAVNFYKRNGFKISGSPFTEAGIIHFKMTLP